MNIIQKEVTNRIKLHLLLKKKVYIMINGKSGFVDIAGVVLEDTKRMSFTMFNLEGLANILDSCIEADAWKPDIDEIVYWLNAARKQIESSAVQESIDTTLKMADIETDCILVTDALFTMGTTLDLFPSEDAVRVHFDTLYRSLNDILI